MPTQKITTPRGELEWVTISGEGKENLSGKLQYLASVILPADDAIFDKIAAYWEAEKPKSFKRPAKSLGVYPVYTTSSELDEDGKPVKVLDESRRKLTFKTGTTYPSGDPKKIQVYNAKAQKVELGDRSIGNGSLGQVSGAMGVYLNKSKTGSVVDAGVTLYLNAIKISKLEEFSQDSGFGADDDAGDDAFTGADESGFVGDTDEARPRL